MVPSDVTLPAITPLPPSVAPDATVTRPAPSASFTSSVPLRIAVAPPYVLPPESVSVPTPVLVNDPEPLITPP